jgi:hypothetical protein
MRSNKKHSLCVWYLWLAKWTGGGVGRTYSVILRGGGTLDYRHLSTVGAHMLCTFDYVAYDKRGTWVSSGGLMIANIGRVCVTHIFQFLLEPPSAHLFIDSVQLSLFTDNNKHVTPIVWPKWHTNWGAKSWLFDVTVILCCCLTAGSCYIAIANQRLITAFCDSR